MKHRESSVGRHACLAKRLKKGELVLRLDGDSEELCYHLDRV